MKKRKFDIIGFLISIFLIWLPAGLILFSICMIPYVVLEAIKVNVYIIFFIYFIVISFYVLKYRFKFLYLFYKFIYNPLFVIQKIDIDYDYNTENTSISLTLKIRPHRCAQMIKVDSIDYRTLDRDLLSSLTYGKTYLKGVTINDKLDGKEYYNLSSGVYVIDLSWHRHSTVSKIYINYKFKDRVFVYVADLSDYK